MIARNITAPYSAVEAWGYDRYVAGAVNRYVRELQDRWLAAVPSGGSVLDVGCGGGQNARTIATERPDLRVTGLDLSPRQVARARRRTAALGGRVQVVEGSALELPFGSATFDYLISIGSIKHWPDRGRGLGECVRVVRPGGTVVIAEADRGCQLDDARGFVARWRVPRLLRPVALAGFRTWVAGQGLDLDEARALLDQVGVTERFAERVAGAPFLVFGGVVAPPVSR